VHRNMYRIKSSPPFMFLGHEVRSKTNGLVLSTTEDEAKKDAAVFMTLLLNHASIQVIDELEKLIIRCNHLNAHGDRESVQAFVNEIQELSTTRCVDEPKEEEETDD
jgi:hypothetical protein